MKMNFELFDLKVDKIKESIEYSIELFPKHFIFTIDCFVNKAPDTEEGEYEYKEDVYTYHKGIYKKEAISAIEMYNKLDSEDWEVSIAVDGMANDVIVRFRTQEKAQEFFNQMQKYVYGK